MPAYLPPFSRREFLSRLLASAAALGVSPSLIAGSRKVDGDCWALLADTHIPEDPLKTARDINMVSHFNAVTRDVLELPRCPGGLIVAGDCAFSSGEKEDYKIFAGLLEPLRAAGLPMHLLLGNHDNRAHFWNAFSKSKKCNLPGKHVMILKCQHVNWFLLDSLEKTNSTPGLIGQEQLDWLARELDKRASRPAIVVVHHNPGSKDSIGGLRDTEPFLGVIRPRRHVKALVYGHTHNWQVEQDGSGIHLINLPPTAYVFREGKPSGWVRAQTRPKGIGLELRCVDKKHALHGQTVELEWRM